jgi:hypothetical protein
MAGPMVAQISPEGPLGPIVAPQCLVMAPRGPLMPHGSLVGPNGCRNKHLRLHGGPAWPKWLTPCALWHTPLVPYASHPLPYGSHLVPSGSHLIPFLHGLHLVPSGSHIMPFLPTLIAE